MRAAAWSFVMIVATSISFAQRPMTSVSVAVDRASQALHGFRMASDEPVPESPKAELVPGNGEFILSLSPQAEPGLTLFRQLQAMDRLSFQPCSGDPCRELWVAEEGYFSGFASMYQSTIPFLFTADKELGDLANKLARHVCKAKYTVNEESQEPLYRLLVAQNEVLPYLKMMQVNAGRRGADVATCAASDLPVE